MNKVTRRHIKSQVSMAITSSQLDVHELVELLEITVDDVLKNYGHRLVEHAEKFGIYAEEIDQEEGRAGREETLDED